MILCQFCRSSDPHNMSLVETIPCRTIRAFPDFPHTFSVTGEIAEFLNIGGLPKVMHCDWDLNISLKITSMFGGNLNLFNRKDFLSVEAYFDISF